ncbi:MAG: alpha-hydroxy-acid oxidizing protein [Actinomycetota bacterium]|nr:alpha-hydroxy-acid oxidizing protein [Actinomycetota bacterium]
MTDADPIPLLSLADYEAAAAEILDPAPHSYLAGGACDELTLRDNVAAWQRWAIRPRMLVGVGTRQLEVELLGRRRAHPVLIAPTAFQRLAHREAELGTARAATATDTIMCLSTLSTTSLEEVAQATPDVTRWFQLYVFKDRGVSHDLVQRAVASGYEALVVTVDLPLFGKRERELRSAVRSSHAEDVASAAAAGASGEMTPEAFGALVDPDLRWTDIERFAAESPLPVLVKGVLTPEDAQLAAEHGAAGVIVSNHGGRQLDGVLSGADALPAVAQSVGDRLEVLVDGGIRRGTDVLKALALGARAVMVGRPVISGLAVGGASGVQRVLEILLAELDNALGLAGAPRACDLDQRFVVPAPWARP